MSQHVESAHSPKRWLRRARVSITLVFCFPSLCLSIDKEWINQHQEHLSDLFEAVSKSTLAPVSDASRRWEQGQREEACYALLQYYRNRPPFLAGLTASQWLPQNHRFHADAWLENRTSPLGIEAELTRLTNGNIDWYQRGAENDKEFAWMLNRHLILPLLLTSHRMAETGGDQYLNAAEALVIDWVTSNPYPNHTTFSPSWRPLEVARRILDSWAPSFDYWKETASDEALLLFLSSIPHHGDSLEQHASFWGGNHLLTEKIALVLISLQWPEFNNSSEWWADGLDVVTEEFIKQTYPDGAYKELSNHYQKIVLQNVQHLLEILYLGEKSAPLHLTERLEIAWDFYAKTSKPDGTGPLNNDSDIEFGRGLIEEAAQFYNRDDWLHIATTGQNGEPPKTISPIEFPWAGSVIFRDSYETTSDWAYFDVGPYGTAHQHNDKLHLSAVLNGKDFLVDQGRYSYYPDDWRRYFSGPAGHNTVEFEDQNPRPRPHKRRTPKNALLYVDRIWSVASGDIWNDAFPIGTSPSWLHRRFVVHHKDAGFFVVDHLIGFGSTKATVRWHFAPSLERNQIEADFELHATTSPNFDLQWHHASENPIAGWHSEQYNQKAPAWQADYVVSLEKPEIFVWSIGWNLDAKITPLDDTVTVDTASGSLIINLLGPSAQWHPSQ